MSFSGLCAKAVSKKIFQTLLTRRNNIYIHFFFSKDGSDLGSLKRDILNNSLKTIFY